MKICFKCGALKAACEFYRHPEMGDGRLGKCKECNKADVRANYRKTLAARRAYEKKRNQTKERQSMAREMRAKYKTKYPHKVAARIAVGNALRAGRLIKQPCRDCGLLLVEAHHPDYSMPLDVIWLCHLHHRIEEGRSIYKKDAA